MKLDNMETKLRSIKTNVDPEIVNQAIAEWKIQAQQDSLNEDRWIVWMVMAALMMIIHVSLMTYDVLHGL